MLDLIDQAGTFLEPRHFRSDPRSYARNLVYDAGDESLSLYSIVWLPGQWTPVHDHGSWGVVGVIEGVLEERSYVRLSPDRGADADIDLARGGTVLLRQGAVTSFVPNPDHIHVTGVPSERASGRQPAPLRPDDERLQHLRRRGTDPSANQRRPQRELSAAAAPAAREARLL